MNRVRHIPRAACGWLPAALAVLFCGAALLPERAAAQSSWEYSPYQMQVWLTVGPAAELDDSFGAALRQSLLQRADAVVGACWKLTIGPPPAKIAADVALDVALVSTQDVEELAHEMLVRSDKLMLMNVSANPREYVIRVRELDCRTRHFGPVIERRVRQPDCLAAESFAALVEAFAAVVRIEQGEVKHLVVRLRAGGLILDPNSPAYISAGQILQPIVRKNDRLGQYTRIDVVEWTFLQVMDRNKTNPNVLNCYVHSAMRSPIRGRGGSRREQYALAIRPTHGSTQLVVEAQVRSTETPYPLPGLEVYSKLPSTDPTPQTPEEQLAAAKKNPAVLLGYTDWRGAKTIEPYEQPLRIVYLKNGGQLLRRLPIVPGLDAQLVAQVPDDDPRLQAEGYIRGFHGELMDLVAQRQILAALIKKRIEDGKTDEAKTLLSDFRALPSRNNMLSKLNDAQRRQKVSPNKYVQGRIDTLYADTKTMLTNYLDPTLTSQLTSLVNRAEQGGAGTSE